MTRKRRHASSREDEPESVSTDAGGRVPDTKGDVGFRGGRRPDSGEARGKPGAPEPARPRDTGRQGS